MKAVRQKFISKARKGAFKSLIFLKKMRLKCTPQNLYIVKHANWWRVRRKCASFGVLLSTITNQCKQVIETKINNYHG